MCGHRCSRQAREISFAYQSFGGQNPSALARHSVTCVMIVGLARSQSSRQDSLYTGAGRIRLQGITPYLTAGTSPTIVHFRRKPPRGLPAMVFRAANPPMADS